MPWKMAIAMRVNWSRACCKKRNLIPFARRRLFRSFTNPARSTAPAHSHRTMPAARRRVSMVAPIPNLRAPSPRSRILSSNARTEKSQQSTVKSSKKKKFRLRLMKALLAFKLVYHERYDLNLGPHVFPSQKFRLIYEMLLREGIATQEDFLRPNPAADEDILRVHTADWVRKLKTGTLTASDVMKLEVPYSKELVEAVWLAAGGSILAAQSALRDGFASNLSGGFHHAYPGHGEGFCAIHDVAVALRKHRAEENPKKRIVVHTDGPSRDRNAAILLNHPPVLTPFIYHEKNYPAPKTPTRDPL